MTVLFSYTDSDKLRSVLGVSVEELEDAIIAYRDLEKEINVSLHDWLPNHATIYGAGNGIGATADQVYQADLLVLYCTYYAGFLVLTSPLTAIQKISDGKNLTERFSSTDPKAMQGALLLRAQNYQGLLLAAQGQTTTNSLMLTQFSGAGLADDPVTRSA
jgi:uncharacterized membrane protein (UPF0182 family)